MLISTYAHISYRAKNTHCKDEEEELDLLSLYSLPKLKSTSIAELEAPNTAKS